VALKYPMGMIARALVLNLISDFGKDAQAEPDSMRESLGVAFHTEGKKLTAKQLERLGTVIEKQTAPMFKRFDKQLKKFKQRQKDKASGKTPKKVPPPGFGKKKKAVQPAKAKSAKKKAA